jgi:HEAT repeat protein
MEDKAARAVPAIAKLLADPNDYMRGQAAVALGQIGPPAREAVPALLEQLKRTDAALQNNALAALKTIGAEAKVAVPKLVEFVRTSKNWSVGSAFKLLGEYGPRASPAGPALLAILHDASHTPFVRSSAGLALAQVDPARAKKEALSDLRALLQADRSNMVAVRAILLASPDDPETLVILDAGLKNTYHYTRSSAADTAGQLGARGKRFVPALKRLLDDPQYYPRGRAALALWQISGNAGDALPTLKALLRHKGQSYARAYAAGLLAEMGAQAKPAWNDLLAARKDSDAYVRSQADAALKKIDPRAAARAGVP